MRKILLVLVAVLFFSGLTAPFAQTVRADEAAPNVTAPPEAEEPGDKPAGGVLDKYLEFVGILNKYHVNKNKMSLVIYCDTITRTYFSPPDAEDLLQHCATSILVKGHFLIYNVQLLGTLTEDKLIPVSGVSYTDARLYYVFETEDDGPILEVLLYGAKTRKDGGGYAVRVNGNWYEMDPVFLEIVWPFLPDSVKFEYESWLTKGKAPNPDNVAIELQEIANMEYMEE